MATNIANLNVKLIASVDGFTSGLGKAGKALGGFVSQAASVASGLAVFSIAEKVATAFYDLAAASMEGVDATAKLADSLGITTENLVGLQYAADLSGVSSEELASGLTKMLKVVGEAGTGAKSAVEALDRIGLSAEMLKGQSPDQVFATIADRLNGITDPAERAAATMEIFGKGGRGLIPLLAEGSDGLAAMQARAEELGLTFSRVDAAQVEMANDAISDAGKVIQGLGQDFAVQLAPFIQEAATLLTNFGTEGGRTGGLATAAVEMIASGVAYLADYLELVKAGWYGLKAAIIFVAEGAVRAIDLVGSGLTALVNLLPGVEVQWSESWATMADDLKAQVGEATDQAKESLNRFNEGANSNAVASYFEDVRAKAKAAAEEIAKTKSQMDGVGTGARDLAAEEEAEKERERAAKEQAKEEERLAREAAREVEKLQDEGQRVFESTRSPAEALEAEIARLKELFAGGFIDEDTLNRAITAAEDKLAKDKSESKAEAPELLTAGSAAAADFAAQFEARARQDDTAKKQFEESKKQTSVLQGIRDSLKNQPEGTIVYF